jgi:hypothetical protein
LFNDLDGGISQVVAEEIQIFVRRKL